MPCSANSCKSNHACICRNQRWLGDTLPTRSASILLRCPCRVVTLIFAAIVSAILFLMGVNAPSMPNQRELLQYQNLILKQSNSSLLFLNTSNNALPTPDAALAKNISTLGSTTSQLMSSKAWLDSNTVSQTFISVNYLLANNTDFALASTP